MRRTIIPTIAAALMAMPAAAQTVPHADMLAPGEVALHVVAHGETTTPADRIVVTATVTGKGATAAEAEAATTSAASRTTAALVAAGIERGAIVVTAPNPGRSMTAPPVITSLTPAPTGAAQATPRPAPAQTATATMTVTVGDHAALDRVTRTIAAQGQSTTGRPATSLRDPAPARRAATVSAIAQARREADDYAAALGMRVTRVVAVSNAAGLADGVQEIADMVERFGNSKPAVDTVVTRATVSVDYILEPKR